MKKIILTLIAFLPFVCSAQFELTPNGLVDQSTKKDFIVKDFPGKSAVDLYNKSLVSITSIYKSPNTVASKVEGEIINVNGTGTITVKRVMNFDYIIEYNLIIRFKDGKVRFDSPLISSIYTFNGYNKKCYIDITGSDAKDMGSTIHVFKSNGEIKQEKIKNDIEKCFNAIFYKIISDINGGVDNDW